MYESRVSTAAGDGEEKQGLSSKGRVTGVQSGQSLVPDPAHQAMKMGGLPCDRALRRSGCRVKMTNEMFALKCMWEDRKQQTRMKSGQRVMTREP